MRQIILALAIIGAILMPSLALGGQAAANPAFKNCGSGSAAGTPDVCASASAQTSGSGNPIIKIIRAAIEVISILTGGLAVVFIVISGLRFITAAGSPDGIAGARSALIYALVGVAVTVLAQAIVEFVLSKA